MALAVQSIRWIAFGIAHAHSRTIVHFFPSEGGVSAPYPATCALRIFGPQMQERKVVIEGARLSHPDGIRLEQAFPFLSTEQIGLFGVEIEVATIQPRVDVSPSRCVVEMVTKGYSVRYWPLQLAPIPTLLRPEIQSEGEGAEATASVRGVPFIRDAFGVPSIVAVNGSTETYLPKLALRQGASSVQGLRTSLFGEGVLSSGADEFVGDDALFTPQAPRETSWGLVRSMVLTSQERSSSACRGAFLLYRDPLTRRPLSVIAL